MTPFRQPSNGHCHSAAADFGAALPRSHTRTAKSLADVCLTEDDIVRPELRNDVMLAGGQVQERRTWR